MESDGRSVISAARRLEPIIDSEPFTGFVLCLNPVSPSAVLVVLNATSATEGHRRQVLKGDRQWSSLLDPVLSPKLL